jgi:hypothetical protein
MEVETKEFKVSNDASNDAADTRLLNPNSQAVAPR